MSSTLVSNPFLSNSAIKEARKPPKILSASGTARILCSSSAPDHFVATEISGNNASLTGGAYDFKRATTSLSQKLLSSPKKITLVRHGLSSWNKEGRIQKIQLPFTLQERTCQFPQSRELSNLNVFRRYQMY